MYIVPALDSTPTPFTVLLSSKKGNRCGSRTEALLSAYGLESGETWCGYGTTSELLSSLRRHGRKQGLISYHPFRSLAWSSRYRVNMALCNG